MKKKLLEKDIFYLSLFICIGLVAFGGIFFTNKNLNKLISNKNEINKNDEINLIKDKENKDNKIATSTESNQNLQQAKQKKQQDKQQSDNKTKLSYIGDKVIRQYSDTMPTYSKTLDVWEIHKALDVSAKEGAQVKSILDGKVASVYSDDSYGTSIEMSYNDNIKVIYSGIQQNVSLKKGDTVKEGECIGYVGNTTNVENQDGPHVHIEAYKENKAINPLSLLE